MNPEELLEKTRAGKLTQEEFDEIVVKVIEGSEGKEVEGLDCLLPILGLVGYPEQLQDIVEKFLYYPKNPFISRLALIALCYDWNLMYLSEIKSFIKGVDWDVDDEARKEAMSIAGLYLSDNSDRDLLQLLLNIFDHFGETDEFLIHSHYRNDNLKATAYHSLCTAMQKDDDEILDEIIHLDVEELIEIGEFDKLDMSVINQARQRLKNEGVKG